MWRVLKLVFFGVGVCLVGSLIPNNVEATSNFSWHTDSIMRVGETPIKEVAEDSKTCGGRMEAITLQDGNGYTEACTFGRYPGTRFARYRGWNNEFAYAVAFSSDSSFRTILGLCPGLARCIYGQAGDTLLMQMADLNGTSRHMVIKNFTKYLTRASSYFILEYSEEFLYLQAGDTLITTKSAGVSANGRWAIIESASYGFIRFDFKSHKFTRLAAYDSLPTNSNQLLEGTISDDGRWAAITGYSSGTLVYEVSDSCGDMLKNSSTQYFSEGTVACKSALVKTNSLVLGYISAHAPRFSSNAQRLLLDVKTQTKTKTVTFAPKLPNMLNPYYIAFGDSFSSGEGELNDSFYISPTNTAGNHCHVSIRSYPYLLGTAWDVEASNVACSGSRIAEVQKASKDFIDRSGTKWPSTVSLGVGGNDVGFMGKLKSCIGIGTCEWAKTGNRRSTGHEIKEMFPKLVDIITELKTNLSPATIFLVGYPSVINDSTDASCSMVIGTLLDREERQYMSESIRYLNQVIRSAASYAKVAYADIEAAYQGERLCDTNDSAMNGVRYGDDMAPIPMLGEWKLIGAESFHPTPRGHLLASQRINAQIGSLWRLGECNDCQFNESQLEVGGYWLEGVKPGESLLRQISNAFLQSENPVSNMKTAFNFISNMFAPNSKVRFELHSEIHDLGTFTAESDGSLKGSLDFPGNVEGYHTVHAYGESYSGDNLDIYQTVYLGTKEVKDTNSTRETVNISSNGIAVTDTMDSGRSSGVQGTKSIAQTNAPSDTAEILKASIRANNNPKAHPTYNESLIWWYLIGLAGVGLSLLGVGTWLAKRKKKSLPGHKV